MKSVLVILATLLAFAKAGDILGLTEDCGSFGGSITALTFEGCDADFDDQCEAQRGSTAKGQLTFNPTKPVESLECKIYGIILGVEVPFPGGCPVTDACSVSIPFT